VLSLEVFQTSLVQKISFRGARRRRNPEVPKSETRGRVSWIIEFIDHPPGGRRHYGEDSMIS
jgi:hypothetical protein